jgi:glutamate-1-semialdehyde aminotransferase
MGRLSDELLKRAQALPGLRAGFERSVVAAKAQGARVYDADNVGYIDYQGGGGAAIVGFANQFVLDAVRKALGDVGYGGWVTTEIAGGDAAYLKDVVARFDRFLAGQKPVVPAA